MKTKLTEMSMDAQAVFNLCQENIALKKTNAEQREAGYHEGYQSALAELKQEQKNFENHLNLDNKRLYDERDALKKDNAELREALQSIKARVCGEMTNGWKNQWTTTNSRGAIADICDKALTRPPEVKHG